MIKFLVVDDEEGVSEQLKQFLEERKYSVFAATDGPTALEIAKRERPNIVLLDVRMPRMSGLDVLRELKKIDTKIRVIMLTGFEDPTARDMAKELGASAYITKPYNYDAIVALTRRLISEIYQESGGQ